ncbi:hypothetical protein ABEB36_012836 [Hypothenemus hampei]|uniref:CFAP65 fourth Ig-like domain-containing protein n=1 Tax=Hypothenemus hampei TaxID=57062 RepID=A0ABD1E670_HYPHA
MDKKNYGFTAPPGSVIAEIDESIEEENLSIEGRNIEMNFGKLEIFQERTKYVTFHRPMTDEHIIYNIKRNRSIKSIKSNFELDHYHGVMKRKQNFKLAVTYKPTIASSEDIEIFDYYSDNENIKIIAKGIALGPRCTLSTRRINFYKTREKQILEHKIEICNDSQASAYFKIDLPNEDVFKVEPLEGVINIGSYCLLTIKFSPNKNGLFARKIICFVWNSEPLVLNVVGVFSIETPDLRLKCFRNDQYLGFKTYFDEFQSFSFNITCLDFGSCFNKQPSKSQIIILANNENCSMFADWNRGVKRRTFNIIPDNQTIEANSVGYFQIHFNLDENFNIFQENVLVQIDWDKTNVNEESSKLPVTAMLRLQGHSFEENNEWISNVVLRPEVVYWQPCLPGQIVYTSFLLQNKSHLPALFKLIPPKKSNVTAKPLMGKFRDTALIAIRLQTEVLKLKTYIEEWKIIINGRENKPLTIHFHGETCIPEIEIGKKNKINAGAVQNNTTKDIDVQMKNLSYYSISFQFQRKNKSIIDVFPKSGILPINGLKQLTIKATGNICAPQKNYLSCQMRVIDSQGSITGDCYDTEIEVDVESSYSQLCACPSYKDFGRMPFGQKVKCQFQAVNFGVTNIFYQTCQSGEEPRDTNFRIKPSFGEVKPKESQTFSILGLLRQTGNQDIHFGYYNRMVKDSPYVTGKPITLFKLSYCTEFPIIQIDEIVEHNFGSLIGKNHLYLHYFEVPKLNKILQTILNDEEIDVVLRMPECEIQEKQYFVILALTNISDFDTEVTIKRKQICHCKMEETSESVFERKTSFKCPHRGVLEVELQDNKFHVSISLLRG